MFNFDNKYSNGYVLGGGGARGFAHLGVVQALQEHGIKPDVISGVSAGAIVGAFIAAGFEPKEVIKIIKGYKFLDITRLRFPKLGLLSLDVLADSIRSEIGIERLEDLEIPLIITISNMLKGEVEYATKGPLPELVQASSAIPVLFNPVVIGKGLYSDGGVFDNLPIKPLEKKCRTRYISNISPIKPIDELNNLAHMVTRMFQLSVNARRLDRMKKTDIYIAPDQLTRYDIMDTKNADEIYNIGYEFTKKLLNKKGIHDQLHQEENTKA